MSGISYRPDIDALIGVAERMKDILFDNKSD